MRAHQFNNNNNNNNLNITRSPMQTLLWRSTIPRVMCSVWALQFPSDGRKISDFELKTTETDNLRDRRKRMKKMNRYTLNGERKVK